MAYDAESSVVKFENQDFRSLQYRCLRRGELFVDDTFPAADSSIGEKLIKEKDLSNLEWKRPTSKDLGFYPPHFILEGASRFDIQQGKAGDCWFLAALGSLTQNPKCLQKILMDQSYTYEYAGIFQFRFWQCDRWVEVVIDDQLPTQNNQLVFVHPRKNNNEFWPCLMEKAYAKLLGSYSQLHYGFLLDGLVDLTGGVVTVIEPYTSSPSNLLMTVKTALQAGSMITCATRSGIQYQGDWEEIIRLWNPWGEREWRGRWKDGSKEWRETQDPRKSQLYEEKEDGEFWMSCQDFLKNFTYLYICSQNPITMNHGVTSNESWEQMRFTDKVIPRNRAGEHGRDLYYPFTVQEGTTGNNVVVTFTLMPQSLDTEEERRPLEFRVWEVDSQFQNAQRRWSPEIFSPFRSGAQGPDYGSKRYLIKSYHLSPGTYVVVPTAYGNEVKFLLQIFLKMPDKERDPSSIFNLRALKGSLPESGYQKSSSYRHMDQGLNIDATQLQSLLNQEFLTGPPGDTFSLDQCQSIMALMDLKVNGLLDQEEFARLRRRLIHCQHVFQNVQRRPGVLLSSDLRKVIENTDFLSGVFVSSKLLSLMELRYKDSSGHVSFPSLVCFLIRLETMAKAFRNLSQDGKGIYLTEAEWMNLVMYN
ncbi:calpain-13 [Mus pahari]|uniref:calpain-13 n=1 Tax=Mus pahari TaxID=10093 RepID=UPI000A30749F|nr:calpain-13 [Mus pahari]